MDGIGHLIVDDIFLNGLKSVAVDEIADQVDEIREVYSLSNNHENNDAIEKLAIYVTDAFKGA